MKIHWGKGLVIVFVVFAVGILAMVRISMNREVDLVSDDYYQQELRHQDQIESERRSNNLSEHPNIGVTSDEVSLTMPKSFPPDSTSGTLTFYRPADRHRDFIVKLRLDSTNTQLVSTSSLQKGLWRLKVRWAHHRQEYYHEEALVIQ
jgi:nitrogen fixation protein FixH